MFDKESNAITLAYTPNPNLLVWGKSGQGKTFFFCREMEKAVKQGKKILIVDFSGSYTKEELKKSDFSLRDKVCELNPCEHPVFWNPFYEKEEQFSSDLSDALTAILEIESYFQRKWLKQAVEKHIQKRKNFQISEFIQTLEDLYQKAKTQGLESDDIENLRRLLTRFCQFESIRDFYFKQRKERKNSQYPVVIYQLSQLPEQEKRFLAEVLITLFWQNMKRKQSDQNVLVLDEFQFLQMRKGSAMFDILRQGRKFELSAFLGTQFISNYDREKMESLLQAGSILIFKPSPRDMKFSASIINTEKVKIWQGILQSLEVGEAVLVGQYTINCGTIMHSEPIVCRI